MSHVTYRSHQQCHCFLMLHVTVLVPVGTQLHCRDSHAGLTASWYLICSWDSYAGAGLFTGWYLASMAGLPHWYLYQLVPRPNGRIPTLVLVPFYQLVPSPKGRTPTLVFKHSDLDLIAKQHRYSAAISDPDYAQNNLTLQG